MSHSMYLFQDYLSLFIVGYTDSAVLLSTAVGGTLQCMQSVTVTRGEDGQDTERADGRQNPLPQLYHGEMCQGWS